MFCLLRSDFLFYSLCVSTMPQYLGYTDHILLGNENKEILSFFFLGSSIMYADEVEFLSCSVKTNQAHRHDITQAIFTAVFQNIILFKIYENF